MPRKALLFRTIFFLLLSALLLYGAIHSGSKTITVATTAEPLSTSSVSCSWIVIQPISTNTDVVTVGDSTVTEERGTTMGVGDSLIFPYTGAPSAYNLSLIYVKAKVNGEGVKFNYGRP